VGEKNIKSRGHLVSGRHRVMFCKDVRSGKCLTSRYSRRLCVMEREHALDKDDVFGGDPCL
jgi:hypothetical protein